MEHPEGADRVTSDPGPQPAPLLRSSAREGPRRLWRRCPACFRARGGSAPPCCRGKPPACAACPAPGCVASRPRRRLSLGPQPPGSWWRPRRPRALPGRVPEQVSARRAAAGNEWEAAAGRLAVLGFGSESFLSGCLRSLLPLCFLLPCLAGTCITACENTAGFRWTLAYHAKVFLRHNLP